MRVPSPRPRRPSPRPADPEGARAERRSRALEEPLDIRPRPDRRFLHLEIRNPVRATRYDVLFPEYPALDAPFCTCTDYARRGIGTCKHIEAARIWLGAQPGEVPPPPVLEPDDRTWTEIDRREKALGRLRLPAPRRIRYVGAALIGAGAT